MVGVKDYLAGTISVKVRKRADTVAYIPIRTATAPRAGFQARQRAARNTGDL